ncbi:glycosyltransferase [Mesorhizobium sp. NZP2077]|uniref:glycosyltransferase n=1 Tax=Mesorhizobium sp. NZP2077 TaxID=2483404 RepID=UPI0015557C80|nr:glycosyltransferase [Mesorhizobium sp. NZP2077]QKC80402.1 glycosyltransferase family 1 protein [Mesorhizobium sp. NZP2077]QKD13779.1 glycosyltransferase [Mesorhizobium sp. NZP2077]
MDRFGQTEFEEMIGAARSPSERRGIASRAAKLLGKARLSAAKRIPFLLPVQGPLRDLDGGMVVSIYAVSHDPLILYTPIGGARPLSTVAAIGRRLAKRRATLLLSPNWTLERPHVVSRMGADLAWYRQRFPLHELIFLCNTEEERRLVAAAGGTAIVSNHNLMVSEEMFRPLPDVPVVFDAVYNGRISHTKRHYLALDIERLVHITFSIGEVAPAGARAFIRRLQVQSPLHHIANPIVDGMTAKLTTPEVNRVYNQAAVGLCLSAEEGAMYSSMEYLLAGLPIVSTPSLGGRDVFFDPDYCMIVEPEPAAIRRAVERLRDRAIPREEIRGRTLEKVRAGRLELTAYLSALKRRLGSSDPPFSQWPFQGAGTLMRWATLRQHAREIAPFKPPLHRV